MPDSWRSAVVQVESKIVDVVKSIDTNGLQMAMVVDRSERLVGIVTDGDVRRAILGGLDLNGPVLPILNRNPKIAHAPITRAAAVARMQELDIAHLPIVDADGIVVGLEMLRQTQEDPEQTWVVVMAGGLGTRLAPLTDTSPKPLLPVGGLPMIELIVRSLVMHGLTRIFLSINYRGEMIRAHCRDGSQWGAEITYLMEDEARGTAGSLTLLPPGNPSQILVMNGDILTNVDFAALVDFHRRNRAPATMCIREQKVQIEYGVVQFDGPYVADIIEKPQHSCFVNAGIYVLSPSVLSLVPPTGDFGMPSLFKLLIADNQRPAAFPLREFWMDIGTHVEYKRAQREAIHLDLFAAEGMTKRQPHRARLARNGAEG